MLKGTFGDLGTQRRVRLRWGEEYLVPLVWNCGDDEVDQKYTMFLFSSYGFTETINGSFLLPSSSHTLFSLRPGRRFPRRSIRSTSHTIFIRGYTWRELFTFRLEP